MTGRAKGIYALNRMILITGVIVGLLVISLGAGFLVWDYLSEEPETYNGTLLDPPGEQEDFTLAGPGDSQVNLADFRDKIVVMYFGYTNCPDFCPGTLSKLKQVRDRLGDHADDIQVMMISVDPERDTPDDVGDYVANFDPSFIGVTGSEEELQSVAADFGIYFAKSESESESGYLVDHTTTVVVLDREGRQRLFLNWDLGVDEIVNDLENIM